MRRRERKRRRGSDWESGRERGIGEEEEPGDREWDGRGGRGEGVRGRETEGER